MTDYTPTWLDEPYPLDHTITWREHYAQKLATRLEEGADE